MPKVGENTGSGDKMDKNGLTMTQAIRVLKGIVVAVGEGINENRYRMFPLPIYELQGMWGNLNEEI